MRSKRFEKPMKSFWVVPVLALMAFGAQAQIQPTSVAVGDFNNDGKLDLAVANNGSNNVSVFTGNGDGTFGAPAHYAVGTGPQSVAAFNFLPAVPYLAVANAVSNNVTVLADNSTNTGFIKLGTFAVQSNPESVAAGDFNSDGIPDLAVANNSSNSVSILLGSAYGASGNYGAKSLPISVAVGDFNGDGCPDLAVALLEARANVAILLNGHNGGRPPCTGVFGAAKDYSAAKYPWSVAVGDFNGDGRLDLAVADQGSNQVSVLLGNGNGTFKTAVNYAVGSSPVSVAVGDFNGDGCPDLAVANFNFNFTFGVPSNSSTVSILLNQCNGTGKFVPGAPPPPVGDQASSVAVGDLDGDGCPDLAVTNYTSGIIYILLNTPTGGTPACKAVFTELSM